MRASSVPVRTSSVQHNAVAIYDAWDLPPLVNNFVPNGGSLADYFFCIEQKRGALLTVADKRATIEALARSHVQAFFYLGAAERARGGHGGTREGAAPHPERAAEPGHPVEQLPRSEGGRVPRDHAQGRTPKSEQW